MLWTSHTNLVCMKLSMTIGIIKRLKYTFPNKKLSSLYNSLFIPYIQYGLLLWGSKYSNVESWLKLNKLSLNADKTKYMIFHSNQRMIPPIALSINSNLYHKCQLSISYVSY